MVRLLLTFKEDLNNFLKNNALYLCIALVILIAITVFLIIFLNRKNKSK